MDSALLFALAAGCGAGARYGLTLVMLRFLGATFPWGTFLCNILGSFFFGMIWSSAEGIMAPHYKDIVLSGFLGSFTTFSTFIFDAHIFLKEKRWGMFCAQIAGSLLCGFGAFALGVWI